MEQIEVNLQEQTQTVTAEVIEAQPVEATLTERTDEIEVVFN